jgi:SAM-dependent methyltransferase
VTAARFQFGANWANFSRHIDEPRRVAARESISARLGDLAGLSFLDAGCGSGLFSLAAVELGAERVFSFDLDADSVATTRSLHRRFGDQDRKWTIEQGDVLDRDYVDRLGTWDIVYSWGVLHHTGDMTRAWENVARAVAPGGRLFISIYNDQGRKSRIWSIVKRTYHRVPARLRPVYVILAMGPREAASAVVGGPVGYLRGWRQYRANRGMSRWHDLVDWVGGYPFEVAKPEVLFAFFRDRGFQLEWMLTCAGGLGCNQFVLRRSR